MMSCVQGTGFCKPGVILPNRAQLKSVPCTTRRALVKLNATTSYPLFVPKLKGRQKRGVMCVLGGKDKSEDEKQPWEAFGKNMGNLKGQSIEDLLRQQIEKKEYYNGSGGKSPPRGGGGGGSGGNGYGDSGDETGKRILATIFVILVVK
ncbi:hypothetical protein Pint_26059 [Pistacia integerrima]|uniref:Uncharacterized protein n=1 Tax=Pistacia integerrima TaxID=434235 RepID=A0ACC0YAN1_9ROSI|nr:hypothetical protein Pint_26059 [Pistacia integerrima]